MRWIIQIASLFGLTIANDLCDGSCAEHVDLIKAFGEEDDVGSLRLLQVARIASSTLPKDEKSHLQVESNNSTASTAMTLPMSWLQETMRAATSGRTVPPLLILVGLALALGVLILLLLQRLDSQRNSNRRGILRAFCDGERVFGTSKSTRSLPEDYAQLFETRTFASKNGKWSYPGMGASFTPGPKAATAELLVSKCAGTA